MVYGHKWSESRERKTWVTLRMFIFERAPKSKNFGTIASQSLKDSWNKRFTKFGKSDSIIFHLNKKQNLLEIAGVHCLNYNSTGSLLFNSFMSSNVHEGTNRTAKKKGFTEFIQNKISKFLIMSLEIWYWILIQQKFTSK